MPPGLARADFAAGLLAALEIPGSGRIVPAGLEGSELLLFDPGVRPPAS